LTPERSSKDMTMLNLTPTPTLNPASAPLPMAAPAAPQSPANPSGQPSFASLLHRSQAPAPAVPRGAERPAEPAPKAERSNDAGPPAAEAPAASAPRSPAHEPARGRDAAGRGAQPAPNTPNASKRSAPADTSDHTAQGPQAGADDDAATAADPALADWLAGLNLPAPNAPAPNVDPANTIGSDDSTAPIGNRTDELTNAAALLAAATAAAPAPARSNGSSERSPDAAARNSVSDATDTTRLAAFTAADLRSGEPGGGGSGSSSDTGADRPTWTPVISASVDVTLQPMPAAQPGRSAALPLAVDLPTPLHAPEFPHALGAQLTVLAHGGVEHAELHLNPAEMGPVSVQIVMDGTLARIDFGADTAATRQAIEASLPELASALRDAGLTLSGGGVSQHSRHRQDTAEARGPGTGRADAEADDSTPTPLRRTVRAGGIDAYA
jgi:flagellar hook-length control protein FliK